MVSPTRSEVVRQYLTTSDSLEKVSNILQIIVYGNLNVDHVKKGQATSEPHSLDQTP